MPSLNRSAVMPLDEVGVYHCYNRCVQQAFLCGFDHDKQIDYSNRKPWIREKLKRLASAFAIDIFKYSLMDNHLHLLLRNRPDLVREWSDYEVVRRWWEICPERIEADGSAAEPELIELDKWLSDSDQVVELRSRLADPSWLMQIWCSYIGRRANREVDKSGRFFEERFKSIRLLDEAAVLACSLYIDLNPIRACAAKTPEESKFTSVCDRIEGRRQRLARATAEARDINKLSQDGGLPLDVMCAAATDEDAWLCRLTLDAEVRLAGHLSEWFDEAASIQWEELDAEQRQLQGRSTPAADLADPKDVSPPKSGIETETADDVSVGISVDNLPGGGDSTSDSISESTHTPTTNTLAAQEKKRRMGLLHFPAPRASNKGFLSMTLNEYLDLLDWTGRILRADSNGAIPASTPPILERLGIKPLGWLELVDNFRHWFGVAVGRLEQLKQEATRLGRQWLWHRQEMADAFT